jgi:hypothetical protein
MGELEYTLNYVVIKLLIPFGFPILLGRPWLYKAGVLEDSRKRKFRIGSTRTPWDFLVYQRETVWTSQEYTSLREEFEDEEQLSDCWLVVNALKTVTEEEFEFTNPVEDFVVVQEEPDDELGRDWEQVLKDSGARKDPDDLLSRKRSEHALGELDVAFTTEWVHERLKKDPQLQEYYGVFGQCLGEKKIAQEGVGPMATSNEKIFIARSN